MVDISGKANENGDINDLPRLFSRFNLLSDYARKRAAKRGIMLRFSTAHPKLTLI